MQGLLFHKSPGAGGAKRGRVDWHKYLWAGAAVVAVLAIGWLAFTLITRKAGPATPKALTAEESLQQSRPVQERTPLPGARAVRNDAATASRPGGLKLGQLGASINPGGPAATAATAAPATPAAATASRAAAPATAVGAATEATASTPATPGSSSAAGPDSSDAAALMSDAALKEQSGQLVAARKAYTQALVHGSPSAAQRSAIMAKVEALSARTILSPKIEPGDELATEYVVQSGDVLARVAPRYRITFELIKRINGLSSDNLQAGQKLKVVQGPFRVKIFKSQYRLELLLGETLIKSYTVAIGTGQSTPAGLFTVSDKVKNPTFYPPPSQRGKMQVKAGGAADNPLGTRWIKFGESLGIHGTIEPQTIGRSVSLGCVRMVNADVEWLYDFMVPGSQVEIVE